MSPARPWPARAVGAICLLLSALWVGSAVSMLHRGEDAYVEGALIVTAGWIAVLGGVAGAGLAPFRPAWAQKVALFCLPCAAPITLFSAFPRLWCSFMYCQEWAPPFPVVPLALSPLALIAVAVMLLGRGARP